MKILKPMPRGRKKTYKENELVVRQNIFRLGDDLVKRLHPKIMEVAFMEDAGLWFIAFLSEMSEIKGFKITTYKTEKRLDYRCCSMLPYRGLEVGVYKVEELPFNFKGSSMDWFKLTKIS